MRYSLTYGIKLLIDGKVQFVGNLVGDPKFRNPTRGNYRIRSGSPAQNKGTNQTWMDGATDLQGDLRIMNKAVDIGCYEVPVTGMTLLIR